MDTDAIMCLWLRFMYPGLLWEGAMPAGIDDFRHEVIIGIEKLESITGKKINHFAYPYGSPNEIGEREYRLINEFNFKTSFIAYGGCITEENKNNITHLPRVYLHER